MPDWKRVRLEESGHEVTVATVRDGMKVLDKPATDVRGRPLPALPKTTVAAAAGKKKASGGEPAPKPEEGSK
jgi:hypothetical protein